jgi:hypothetical protein
MLKQFGFLSRIEKNEGRLKKKPFIAFSLVTSIFFICGTALAVPMWTDSWDPKNILIKNGKSLTYCHDLTDNGFVPGKDLITGYTLTLSLYDDYDNSPEKAFVNLPGFKSDGFYNFKYDNNEYGWSLAGFLSLNAFGKYSVTISSWTGDFYFDKSILTAKGYSNTAPVPEPASMFLFGTGLIVFGLAGRKLKAR